MQTVRHHGRETAYRLAGATGTVSAGDAGDDERVLYVHGSGATHRVWAAQYGADGPARPAAAVDLSGHGDSDDVDTEPGPETLDAYARDVIAVARETNATVLAGNSLGGAVVQHVALDTEFEPSALVLAGTGAKLSVLDDLREWLTDDFERAVEFLHGDDRLFHDADERTLERSKSEMRSAGQAVTRRDFLTCHTFDVRDRLDEIDTPALAVVGEHDSLTPPAYHEYLAERVPGCEYAEIDDAAHLAMAERPIAFNRTVRAFLDGVER
ncbi:alpha/beta fold hydrolase [Halosimplex salinum]|uniref:alpha/beta fold hydrolase n=1 Tax=Halosimplex salinum TaxID=1710538 RepID=UPI000F4ADFEB|nr:alpha/beta fold hydrolase [Halosimplex salinum]